MQNDEEDVNSRLTWVLEFKGSLPRSSAILGKTVEMQIIWFVVIVMFVTLLPKNDTLLLFFIQKRRTTPRGNTVYYVIFMTLIFKAIDC